MLTNRKVTLRNLLIFKRKEGFWNISKLSWEKLKFLEKTCLEIDQSHAQLNSIPLWASARAAGNAARARSARARFSLREIAREARDFQNFSPAAQKKG